MLKCFILGPQQSLIFAHFFPWLDTPTKRVDLGYLPRFTEVNYQVYCLSADTATAQRYGANC